MIYKRQIFKKIRDKNTNIVLIINYHKKNKMILIIIKNFLKTKIRISKFSSNNNSNSNNLFNNKINLNK